LLAAVQKSEPPEGGSRWPNLTRGWRSSKLFRPDPATGPPASSPDATSKTVQQWVAARDARGDRFARPRRPRIVDPHLEKIEELVERSHGHVWADVVHDRLIAMGLPGDERTTRRAVADAPEGLGAAEIGP